MGNHSLPDHGKNTPYTEDVEFSLVVRRPGVSPGSSDPRLVSNADIPATFADIAGTEPATAVDGRSLLPPMMGREPAGAAPWRNALLVEGKLTKNYPENWPAYEAVRTKGFAYHYHVETGEEELSTTWALRPVPAGEPPRRPRTRRRRRRAAPSPGGDARLRGRGLPQGDGRAPLARLRGPTSPAARETNRR